MKKTDLYWLAGLLEGEGNFYAGETSAWITVKMTDKEPVEQAAKLMVNCRVLEYPNPPLKTLYSATLRSAKHVRSLCLQLRPLMAPRRQAQIDNVLWVCNRIDDDRISGFQKVILVRYLVNAGGLSQSELSRRTGIDSKIISRVMLGQQKRMGQRGRIWAN
jgi:hypothetical protein